ncbi:lipocalin-like domain-containing protein [Calidifontimicrobium sp. SYSU G02091]|uniref:lipocalin-like domain-containing protein n=1 Tax=Calidifontimicrobium sp. SYSU G02091 TaxID=2926421 RepID=UPI001F52BFE9|nr:lipocalin-like domain-containing protein [Calidifontimicrobium sp. SYSU G02091]MCI1191208.1 lipocalin-like domain-containing protein [Calidifontimicrobium sp. SYSU G02091]
MTGADNPLLGSWRLVRWEIAYADGRARTLPYGADAQGLIVYGGDGVMSACIARAGRQRLSSDSARTAPEAERLAAFESYFHYAGPYTLRRGADLPTGLQVVHRVEMALNPNFVGTEQVRNVAFDGHDVLTLSADDTVPGSAVVRHHRLVWRRAST